MSAEQVRIEIIEEAEEDLRALADSDRDTALAVAKKILELRANPHLGTEMDARPPRILETCRKLYLGPTDQLGRTTLRVVYVNEPEDGAPQVVVVLAIGERRRMVVHRRAASRLKRRREA